MNFQNLKTPISDIEEFPISNDQENYALRITYNDTQEPKEKYDHIILPVSDFNLLNYISEEKSEEIKTLIYNKIGFRKYIIDSKRKVDELISMYFSKKSPLEIIDQVLEYLFSISDKGSKEFEIDYSEIKKYEIWRKFYFLNFSEFEYYLNAIERLEFIDCQYTNTDCFGSITLNGISRLYEIGLKKIESNICFVAMAFNDEMFDIYRNAIEPAISSTGFKPEIVSDLQIESDTTINDKIIAGIKKAQFTISDFSYHKNGVYFEAGMALGRGQKVIYSCKESEIDSAHFDVRNYQILVWKDAEDFKLKLIDKIEAFIKD